MDGLEAGGIGDAARIGDAAGRGEAAGIGVVGSVAINTRYQQCLKYYSRYMDQVSPPAGPRWDFLTNHAHVLVCVARDPGIRLRDIATAVGITERAAHRILSELVDEGYVVRERQGRRNRYQVKTKLPLPHPLAEELEVGELLAVLIGSTTSGVAGTPAVGEGD
jgi:DNA-binding transcriptional ArsR family regulator